MSAAASVPFAPAAMTIWFCPAASRTMSAVPLATPSRRAMASTRTPCRARVSINSSPNASRPTAPIIATGCPRRAIALAWFAPLPPGERRKFFPTIVSPGAGSCATSMHRSMFRLPTTVIIIGASRRNWQRKQPPLARLQIAELELAEAASVQAGDVEPLAGKHALHLVKAAFNEFKAGFAGAHDFQLRREAGFGFTFERKRP